MNNFEKQLETSEEKERVKLIRNALEQQLGELPFDVETNLDQQYSGIDRYYGIYPIEYKIREKYYGDILLEIISNNRTNSPGWIERDLSCKFFLYAWFPVSKVITFVYASLRQAWLDNKEEWLIKYKKKWAPNAGYYTISIPIPLDILLPLTQHVIYIEK